MATAPQICLGKHKKTIVEMLKSIRQVDGIYGALPVFGPQDMMMMMLHVTEETQQHHNWLNGYILCLSHGGDGNCLQYCDA